MTNKKPLRVLYVTHEPNLTGASRSLVDLLAALDRSEVEPIVLLRKQGPLVSKLKELGIAFEIIPYGLAVKGEKTKVPSLVKEVVNAVTVARIRHLIRTRNVDLVHNNSLLADVGMRAARASKLPYVVHVRDLVNEDHNLDFIDEVRIRELMASASMNIFISDFVAKKFRSWIGASPYKVIFNAVNVPGTGSDRKCCPFQNAAYNLFLPGRFASGKGQLDAINAVADLRKKGYKVFLTLAGTVGQEDYYLACKAAVENCPDQAARIEEFIDDVGSEYAKSDVTLMCSSAEAMGRVTAEGMLSGTLVIGADAGATSEIITDGKTGLLYKSGDSRDLAEKIEWAINNNAEAATIASAGADEASRVFDSSAYAEQIISIYRDAVDNV